MADISLHTAPQSRTAGFPAWLSRLLRRRRAGDRPTRYTDAELLEFHERNLGQRPVSSEAVVMISLRAGMWGRY